MPSNSDDRLQQLETAVADLQRRVGGVERQLGTHSPAPKPTPLPAPPPPVSTPDGGDAAGDQPRVPDTSIRDAWLAFEKWFGKYGMATGGALLLAIALVWGAMLAYSYIGAEIKLAALGLTAAGLIFFGDRRSRDEKIGWWSQALVAVGYAVGQFMFYAAHHIESLRVIEGALPSSIAMLSLALAAGLHAVWRRSEPIALLSVVLSFVTLSLSTVSLFSVVASALILTGLVLSTVRMRWYTVYAVGAAASYATFLIFTQPQVMASTATATAGLTLCGAFLAVYWLAFNLIGFLLSGGDEAGNTRRGTIIAVTIANAAAFIVPTMFQMGSVFPELRWVFLLGVGIAYLLSVPLYNRRDKLVSSVVLVLGLQFVTACVPLKLDGQAVAAVWLLEAAALTAIGMRTGMPVLRYFAAVLSALCVGHLALFEFPSERIFDLVGLAIPARSLIGLVAAGVFAGCYGLYQVARFERRESEQWFGHGYLCAALALTGVVGFLDVPTAWLPLVWGLQALALLAVSFLPPRQVFANGAFAFFVGAVLVALTGFAEVGLPVVALLAAIGLGAGLIYRLGPATDTQVQTRSEAYFIATAVLMYGFTLCVHHADSMLPVLQLAVQATLLAVAGLLLRVKVLRYLGAVGFGIALFGIGNAFANEVAWTWLANGGVAALLALVGLGYRFLTVTDGQAGLVGAQLPAAEAETPVAREAYALLPAVLMAVTAPALLSLTGTTVAWAIEGALLLVIGFAFREYFVRSAGLLLCIALIGKLLWLDMRGASDVLRFLSFLGAAIVVLTGAWAYFKYTRDEK